jgi:hypothetical protein
MSHLDISLPEQTFEEQLPRLLTLLNQADAHDLVGIDISRVKFLTPAAIVAVVARCHRWRREGKRLRLCGTEKCENLSYLQRIDFLSHLGIEIPESFTRRPTGNRFVPVRSLNFASGNVDALASEITRCVLPDCLSDDDVFQALQYAAGELLSNAKYHSGGRAFACAQFFPARNLVRIAVADDGQGIRESFTATSREPEASTPDDAIRLALQPGVSSALLRPNPNPYGGQNHRGVGLSVTRILAKEAKGRLTIATESGWFDELHGSEQTRPHGGIFFPGTLVAVSLHRDHIADYAEMHEAAMAEIGMPRLDTRDMFLD